MVLKSTIEHLSFVPFLLVAGKRQNLTPRAVLEKTFIILSLTFIIFMTTFFFFLTHFFLCFCAYSSFAHFLFCSFFFTPLPFFIHLTSCWCRRNDDDLKILLVAIGEMAGRSYDGNFHFLFRGLRGREGVLYVNWENVIKKKYTPRTRNTRIQSNKIRLSARVKVVVFGWEPKNVNKWTCSSEEVKSNCFCELDDYTERLSFIFFDLFTGSRWAGRTGSIH